MLWTEVPTPERACTYSFVRPDGCLNVCSMAWRRNWQLSGAAIALLFVVFNWRSSVTYIWGSRTEARSWGSNDLYVRQDSSLASRLVTRDPRTCRESLATSSKPPQTTPPLLTSLSAKARQPPSCATWSVGAKRRSQRFQKRTAFW